MQKPQFVSDEIYHIYNRGVEKRNVFLDDKDYLRFIHDLFEFNDINPSAPSNVRFNVLRPAKLDISKLEQFLEVQPPKIQRPRKLLVEILAFCLMPNHFHLLLRQRKDNGIVKFMQKMGTGYTMYFNQKYERVGGLFQGRFKAVLVEKQSHFMYLPHYIHLNPLDVAAPEWRKGEIKDLNKAIKFLESYRWSSYPDYLGKKNFPSVTQREFLSEFFEGPEQYKQDIINYLKEMEFGEIKDLTLE